MTVASLNKKIICTVIIIGVFFPAYKYIFAYGEPNTSGPYFSEIPFWLLIVDDLAIIFLLFTSIALSVFKSTKVSVAAIIIAVGYILSNIGILLGGDWYSIKQSKAQFILGLFAIVALGFIFRDGNRNVAFLRSNAHRLLLMLLSFSVLQIFLFALIGKPPVLSWSTDLNDIFLPIVRFGSFVSSPNHAACLAVLLLCLSSAKGLYAFFLYVGVFLFLFLAMSLTGYILFTLYIAGRIVLAGRLAFVVLVPFLLATSTVAFIGLDVKNTLSVFLNDPSTLKHYELIILKNIEVEWVSFGTAGLIKNESLYGWLLVNNGIILASIFVAMMVTPLMLALRYFKLNINEKKALMAHFLMVPALFAVPITNYYGIGFLQLVCLHSLYQSLYRSFFKGALQQAHRVKVPLTVKI